MAVVLVTGGSSGIGLATARRLAGAGHRVFSASRNPGRAPEIDGVEGLTFDVTDPQSAAGIVDAVVDRAGRLDVVVNNAGTNIVSSIEDTTETAAHALFETNFFGPLRLARAAVPVMREQGSGRIVNVTSMNDTIPPAFGGYYSASKAALASASLVLAGEVHQFGIWVSVVAPGLYDTPMATALADSQAPPNSVYAPKIEAMVTMVPARLATAADPDDVAAAVQRCVEADEPPVRIVVGADALFYDEFVRAHTADEITAIMRNTVANLGVTKS